MMPHLVATFDFGSYLKNINKMGHFIGNKWEYTKFNRYNNIVLNYYSIVQKPVIAQCNVVLKLKYSGSNNALFELCAAITSCVTNDLNARYCKDEAKGIVCADHYHWGKINLNTFFYLI